jgi:hypothetical protein
MIGLGPLEIALLLIGGLVVILLVWCLTRPVVARMLARILAVILMGLGAGFLVWGVVAAATGESARLGNLLEKASEVIGLGAGCLTGGITALVLSFVGRPPRSIPPGHPGPSS